MNKKMFNNIMISVINKRITREDIENLKKYADLDEMIKCLQVLYSTARSKKLTKKIENCNDIIRNKYPNIFSGQFRDEMLIKEIMGEIKFLTAQIFLESNRVHEYLLTKSDFECLFLKGQFDQALKMIEEFENNQGLSFWSLDCHLLSLSYINASKADKYCNELIDNCDNLAVNAYIKVGKYRFNKGVTTPYFRAKFENIFEEYDEKERNTNIKEAFKKYLCLNIDIARGLDLVDIKFLLILANCLPLIDQYIILEKILGWLCSESIYKECKLKNCVLECALLLREKIYIPFWANICNLMGDFDNILINKEKLVINEGLKLYCSKKTEAAFDYCMSMLDQYPNSFSLMNLMAKCGKNIEKSNPHLELSWFIRRLYLKEEKDTEFVGIMELCNIFKRIYSFFSFGNNLGVIIENETSPIMLKGKMSYINALISLNFTPSKLAFFFSEKNAYSFLQYYKKEVGTLYFSDWQIATYSEANEERLSNYICDNTSYVLNNVQNIDSKFIRIWDDLNNRETDVFNVNICRSFLLKRQFDLAVSNNNLLEAIDIYIRAFFISQWMVLRISREKINEKMTRNMKSYLENHLSYCLYAYITRYELNKGEVISETVINSLKKILKNNDNSVDNILIPEEILERQKVIYFLRNICTYEGLRRVKVGVSLVQELYIERIAIIDKILPYYERIQAKEDINFLVKERKEITEKVEYLDIAKCINKGKINTSWIVFSDEAEGAIMSVYNMYNNMSDSYTLSAYVDAFVMVKKDYVQEINRILSVTIRHGILEGELLRFVKKGKIREGGEALSEVDNTAIEIFYTKIYSLIEKLLGEYIICTYAYESDTKLLLYVDEELLAKSYNESLNNIEGPEDIEEMYSNILNTELKTRLPNWGTRICEYIDTEMRKNLNELYNSCSEKLKTNVNKLSDLLDEEIDKLKEWFGVTENQKIEYRLATLGDVLEQEWGCVNVRANVDKDLIVTGNIINFLYTIIRELIWNAEKYCGFEENSEDLHIFVEMCSDNENIIFTVINNIEENIASQVIEKNIAELKEIIDTVEKSDKKIFNREDIYEGKSGYRKIVKLLKRAYDGKYDLSVEYNEKEFIVKITLKLEALM